MTSLVFVTARSTWRTTAQVVPLLHHFPEQAHVLRRVEECGANHDGLVAKPVR